MATSQIAVRTVPASKLMMIAVRQAMAMSQRTMQEIINAAVESDPSLKGAELDCQTGTWTLPEAEANGS